VRATFLVTLLIVTLAVSMAVYTVLRNRDTTCRKYQVHISFLAEQSRRLVLWIDRVALRDLLLQQITESEPVTYAFVEQAGAPYVHTFPDWGTRGPVGPSWKSPGNGGPSPRPTGKFPLRRAEAEDEAGTVLHLGLSQVKIDRESRRELIMIVFLHARPHCSEPWSLQVSRA